MYVRQHQRHANLGRRLDSSTLQLVHEVCQIVLLILGIVCLAYLLLSGAFTPPVGWQSSQSRDSRVARHGDSPSRASAEEISRLLAQVQQDLEPWKESGITLQSVERAYCSEAISPSMRVQVINGRMYMSTAKFWQSRGRAMQLQLADLQRRFRLPDVDMILTVTELCKPGDARHRSHDGNRDRCQETAPLISANKLPTESHCVLAPDYAFGGSPETFLPSWETARGLLRVAADSKPWAARQDALFWRGSGNGPQRQALLSSKLVKSSVLANVHAISWKDRPEKMTAKFVSRAKRCGFRYLLNLAGNSYSGQLRYILQCGSAAVFPHREGGEPVEFWYHLLRDGRNVVLTDPVTTKNQGEPVLKAVQHLQRNQTWAQEVAAAGRHLAAEVLHPDNVARYWLELLAQYSALQRFNVTLHADAVPLEEALLRPESTTEVKLRTCTVC